MASTAHRLDAAWTLPRPSVSTCSATAALDEVLHRFFLEQGRQRLSWQVTLIRIRMISNRARGEGDDRRIR